MVSGIYELAKNGSSAVLKSYVSYYDNLKNTYNQGVKTEKQALELLLIPPMNASIPAMETSLEMSAYNFSFKYNYNIVYEIHHSIGADICPISCFSNEKEILLQSGQKFKVKEIIDNVIIQDELTEQKNNFKKIILEKIQ